MNEIKVIEHLDWKEPVVEIEIEKGPFNIYIENGAVEIYTATSEGNFSAFIPVDTLRDVLNRYIKVVYEKGMKE